MKSITNIIKRRRKRTSSVGGMDSILSYPFSMECERASELAAGTMNGSGWSLFFSFLSGFQCGFVKNLFSVWESGFDAEF